MQIEDSQVTNSQSKGFSPRPTEPDPRAIFYRPFVEVVLQSFSRWPTDGRAPAKLDNIENSLDTLERLAEECFARREKDIRIMVGRKHHIWLLRNDFAEIKLKREKPLEIMFEKGEELVLAYNDTFNLSGVGSTREEALKELIDFFIHDYFSYKDTPPEKLSKEAKLLLQQYEAVIEIHTKL